MGMDTTVKKILFAMHRSLDDLYMVVATTNNLEQTFLKSNIFLTGNSQSCTFIDF